MVQVNFSITLAVSDDYMKGMLEMSRVMLEIERTLKMVREIERKKLEIIQVMVTTSNRRVDVLNYDDDDGHDRTT